MHHPDTFPALGRRLLSGRLLLAASAALVSSLLGQVAGTGTIEGRVVNVRSGEYLENARVAIEGPPRRETFTDSNGQYRLVNVPAGAVETRGLRQGAVGTLRS